MVVIVPIMPSKELECVGISINPTHTVCLLPQLINSLGLYVCLCVCHCARVCVYIAGSRHVCLLATSHDFMSHDNTPLTCPYTRLLEEFKQ